MPQVLFQFNQIQLPNASLEITTFINSLFTDFNESSAAQQNLREASNPLKVFSHIQNSDELMWMQLMNPNSYICQISNKVD